MAAALLTEEGIQDSATVAARKLGYKEMRLPQLQVVTRILTGRDVSNVFAVLPIGCGKSLCFACLPYIFDLLLPLDQPSNLEGGGRREHDGDRLCGLI